MAGGEGGSLVTLLFRVSLALYIRGKKSLPRHKNEGAQHGAP